MLLGMRKKAEPSNIHLLGIFIELLWQLLFLHELGIAPSFEVSEWIICQHIFQHQRKKKLPESSRIEVAAPFSMLLDRALTRHRLVKESSSNFMFFLHLSLARGAILGPSVRLPVAQGAWKGAYGADLEESVRMQAFWTWLGKNLKPECDSPKITQTQVFHLRF